ncbi:MAG: replication initiation factor domain-containing protein [Ruminiclostridium sp.]|nr:replication initiation factor domain-containing protein [Ruminiclostridium sp.]
MENIILIDWFAMSYRKRGTTPFDVIRSLKLKEDIEFKAFPGRYMYRDRLSFGNIHIYYNNINADQDFPMLEMSGQGCREFETFSEISFDDLFELAKDTENYHVTRLDIAYDDHTGILDINQIEQDYRARNWVSNSTKGRITVDVSREKNSDGRYIEGISVMTGTKSSDMYMRIYDKAIERGIKDGRHWVRCELVLKQDRAVTFIRNTEPIGQKFRGVIHNYFRFLTPSKKDSNRRRWEMRPYWKKFLENAGKISVYTPKDIDYNLSRLTKYVFKQAGNSIDTYIRCVGVFRFFDDLIKRSTKLNPKQKYLIEQCRLLYEQGQQIDEATIDRISRSFKA